MFHVHDALVVDADAARVLALCVATTQRTRQAQGLPAAASLDRLHAELAAVAGSGQADTPDEATDNAGLISTAEAAQLLGVSVRTARRLAPRLGGRRTPSTWLVDRLAVLEHLEGST